VPGLDSKHSFAFGHHYDWKNTHHGLLVVNNDDTVDPGTGFETTRTRCTSCRCGSPLTNRTSLPGYEQLKIDHELLSGGLVPVAKGMPRPADAAAIRIDNCNAALHAARLQPGQSVELRQAPFLHLFVAAGAAVLEGAGELLTGDAVRFTATGGQQVTATEPAEILLWEMHAALPV
jgi:hypothetical protein